MRLFISILISWGFAAAAPGESARWPRFRGPDGSGVADGGGVPLSFGPTNRVLWQLEVPAGHSSPVIWDNLLCLTGCDQNRLWVCGIDRAKGRLVWRQPAPATPLERTSSLGGPACSTPVTDGERVYAYFGSYGLLCYQTNGAPLWQLPLPTPITQHGTGTSPILAGDNVVLLCDQDINSYLLAVDRVSGKVAWKTARPGFRRGFSTPLAVQTAQRELILAAGTLKAVAYDARDGHEVWSLSGLPNEMCASPIGGGGCVYVGGWTSGVGGPRMSDFAALLQAADKNGDGKISREEAVGPAQTHFPYIDADKNGEISRDEWETMAQIFNEAKNAFYAVDPNGLGNITQTRVLWSQTNGLPYVPSPLYYRDRVYLVKNGGLLTCLDARQGKPCYVEQKLGAGGDYYASPVAADGRVVLTSRKGVLTIIKAGDTFEVLARNDLEEPILATPALVDNRLYLRTQNRILAIGD